ncbi:hypothetical protein [Vibrio tetraodonis]|uniref:hypothetical protein n=1 Tax=Vibrio tetraodonis TaxID=2231647 RepID=UPI001370FB9B|nr:hypothetical protein [Vibrio tetraodonis]
MNQVQTRLTLCTNNQKTRDWNPARVDQLTASYQEHPSCHTEMGSSILKGVRR